MKSSPILALALWVGAGVVWVTGRETAHAEKRTQAVQQAVRRRIVLPTGSAQGISRNNRHGPQDRTEAGAQSPPVVQIPEGQVIRAKVTAYCVCEICCEKWSKYAKTATGDDAKIYDGVAADPKLLPYRTRLEIPGIGIKEVDDTGGGMRKSAREGVTHIDVRMPSHSQARRWGVKFLEVKVLK